MRTLEEAKSELLNELGYFVYDPFSYYSLFDIPGAVNKRMFEQTKNEIVRLKNAGSFAAAYRRLLRFVDYHAKIVTKGLSDQNFDNPCGKPGCNLCCSTVIPVESVIEEKFLKSAIRKLPDDVRLTVFDNADRAEALCDSLKKMVGRQNADVDELFSQWGGKCPCLTEVGACAIYESRPWPCRLTRIVGPPCEINTRRNLVHTPDLIDAIRALHEDKSAKTTLIRVIRILGEKY